jgi:ATP-binding cassette subfamily B protein
MLKSVLPYMGEYKKYTKRAAVLMLAGIIFSITPFFFLYQIMVPLVAKEPVDLKFVLVRVLLMALCEILYSMLYVTGLENSHVSAYNTLKNLRISLQGKLEEQPGGNIQDI